MHPKFRKQPKKKNSIPRASINRSSDILHSTLPIKTIHQMLSFSSIQTNLSSSFKSSTKLRNLHGMVLNFVIHTPPLLKHNNSRSILFSNHICVK
ncbi:hypothetical protein CR513_15121, partial [Mucuna pruriens]